MLRQLCCSTPPPSAPSPGAPLADAAPGMARKKQKAKPANGTADTLVAAPVKPSPQAASSALEALSCIALAHPGNPALADYDRITLVQNALDACVPWLRQEGADAQLVQSVLAKSAATNLDPAAAGMLAGVCLGACVAAMEAPRFFRANLAGATHRARLTAITASLCELDCMGPYRRLLESCTHAAATRTNNGQGAVHSALFDGFVDLVAADPPPPLDEISFLQEALVAISSVDVAAQYLVRQSQPTDPMPALAATTRLSTESQPVVAWMCRQLNEFIEFGGGAGLEERIHWYSHLALERAATDADVLQVMYEPKKWRLKDRDVDTHSHLVGTLYHAVLSHMNGYKGSGMLRRHRRAPITGHTHRTFLAHAFTALQRGITRIPEAIIPAAQLQDLHRVALEAIAQDCDAYTVRARLVAFAAAAATSPGLGELGPQNAAQIARAWETLKGRLQTRDYPLDPV